MNWYDIKAKLLSFFSDIRIYPGGVVLAGDSSYKVKGPDMRQVLDHVMPGDILLRRYSHYLGSVLIKGYFSHAAVYVGNNKVIHMLGSGITEEDILTFLRCDDICILRAKDEVLDDAAIDRAKKFLANGIEYDYNFDTESPEKFYCTEFVDNCFEYIIKKEKTDGGYILPDDFLRSPHIDLIWRKG